MKTHLSLIIFCLLLSDIHAQAIDSTWLPAITSRVDSLFGTGNLPACRTLINGALETIQVRAGTDTEESALLQEVLVNVEKGLNDFTAAEQSAMRYFKTSKKVFGSENLNVAKAMGQLGYIRFKLGRMDSVEALLVGSKMMLQNLGLHVSTQYCGTCTNLAAYYQSQGFYLKAEQLHLEALYTYKNVDEYEDRIYGVLLNNLAVFYSVIQRSDEALRRYDESLELAGKVAGKSHPFFLRMMQNKGRVMADAGRYQEAEVILKDALETARAGMAPDDPQPPTFLRSLSLLYGKTGRFEEAGKLEEETLRLFRQKYGDAYPEYILGLLNLAGLSRDRDPAMADTLLRQAIHILERENRTHTAQYAQALTQLGTLCQSERRYDAARPLLENGARLGAETMGATHPGYHALFGEPLIKQHLLENRPDSALTLLDRVRDTILSAYGDRHERYISLESQYGTAWQIKGDAAQALTHFQNAFRALQLNLADNFRFLSTDEREKFARTFERYRAAFLGTARAFPNDQNVCAFLYDLTLFQKELLATYDRQLLRGWQQNADSSYQAYVTVRRMIARQWTLPVKERIDLPELETQRTALEKTLAAQSAQTPDIRAPRPAHWQQVQQTLQAGDAAIEWLRLPAGGEAPCYAALLLRPGSAAPQLVLLPSETQIDALFASKGSRGLQYATRTYTGDALYRALWQPLETRLAGAKRIFYAPTGALHLLNFDAVATSGGKLLAEKFQLVRVANTGRLMDAGFGHSPGGGGSALLAGGLNYESAAVSKVPGHPGPDSNGALWRGGTSVREWAPLPNTLPEVEGLATLLQQKKLSVTTLTGSNGTETAIKESCALAAPGILHFATHGFFFEKNTAAPGSLGLVTAENPMFRSGLILAGANPVWRGESGPGSTDDGILTADEISLLPLHNTALVVLSACETGLGDVHDDEGVYGLQRAFRLAGAKNIVMSLWRVPDVQTREFMEKLYTALLDTGDLRAAFQSARLAMRKQYSNPYYWAGFVLLE